MKLGAIYTVFNGLELLQGSINQIQTLVDRVLIIYQEQSNKGEWNRGIRKELEKIECDKKEFMFFQPNLRENTKMNELKKHDLALQYLKSQGFTHFILMACDHYYERERFLWAKAECIKNDFDVTLTRMYTYFKYPTWRLNPPETYYMPLICRIHRNTRFDKMAYRYLTDPSVRINTRNKMRVFTQDEIIMHHYSMVRVDIENKLRNAAVSVWWTKEMIDSYVQEHLNYDLKKNKGLSYFGGRKVIEVENLFNL